MAKNKYLSGQPTLCQLLSFIPQDLIDESVSQHQSDRYYKTMTTFNFTNTGGTSRCYSNNSSKILSYFIFFEQLRGHKDTDLDSFDYSTHLLCHSPPDQRGRGFRYPCECSLQ